MDTKYTILYVDDEPINLLLFRNMFEENYNVITAESGKEALEILEKNKADVVLSDMRMPEMTGIELITNAKAQYPEINFYILTGYEITAEIKDAINKGLIIEYFQKPFDMQEINTCIMEKLS